jgi:hypothetical protein
MIPSLSRAKLRTNFSMLLMTLTSAPMTSLKPMSMALEVLGSMLTNGVVSLKKHKRNGTSWIKQASQSFWNISSGPPPGSTAQGPPRRDFGRPSGGRFAPRNRPADTVLIGILAYWVVFLKVSLTTFSGSQAKFGRSWIFQQINSCSSFIKPLHSRPSGIAFRWTLSQKTKTLVDYCVPVPKKLPTRPHVPSLVLFYSAYHLCCHDIFAERS